MTWAVLLLLAPSAAPPAPADAAAVASFEKKVRPLLHARCLSCHSAEAKKSRGGLSLDSRAGVLAGGDNGPAVVPGRPDDSLLIRAVRYAHDTLAMPPAGKLPDAEVAVLVEWVRQGAVFPGPAATARKGGIDFDAGRAFWSFRPLATHPAPADPSARTRADAFAHDALRRRGIDPSPEADLAALVRRLSFDLIGLPPTPQEVAAFAADESPDAYERLVDRLLASPRHGERWGRYWLDLARYCDVAEPWAGLKGSPHLYRDWVVRALNEGVGYDEFVKKQLAADLMPGSPAGDKAGLGFLGLAPSYWKELKLDHAVIKGVVAEEWEERIHTLTSTFLGLTAACARCHDHKFDPIGAEDYYALAGVFASVKQADVPLGGGAVAVGVVESSLHVVADGPSRTKLTYKDAAQDVALQPRGNPAAAGAVVPRRFLRVLSPGRPRPLARGSGRLDLAEALVGEAAPLAARVMVNRVWAHHFGRGIVSTPSDFGSQGDRPTHPELLDDLAARFVANGWSLKWLHREIVLSAAYRRSSRPTPEARRADPDNRWLGRGPRRRLEVEAWRDALLAVGGTLDARVGGPAVELSKDAGRRTLYGSVKRRELDDLLRLYDFPDPTTHSAARTPTTTPLQQLYVLNGPLVRGQARALAARLRAEETADEGRIERAYALLFARRPTRGEAALGLAFVREGSWEAYAQVLLATGEFATAE